MNTQDYTTTLLADKTSQETFKDINNVRAWWTEILEGETDKLNDTFKVTFGTTWKTFKITELIPDKKVVWLVTDCCLPWNSDTTEWTGTQVVFEVAAQGGQTQVTFTHKGLVPTVACFKDCSNGWNYYLKGSLYKLLTEGKGIPEIK